MIGCKVGKTTRRKIWPFAGAVDTGGLQHLVGNAQRILTHQKQAKDRGQPRHQRPGVGVHQAHRLQHQEQRQSADLGGHHQGGDQKLEQPLAPGELQLGEGVTGRDGEAERQDGRQGRQGETVPQIPPHPLVQEQVAVMLQRPVRRQQRRREDRRLARRHEADRHHPDQREQDDQGDEGDGEVEGKASYFHKPSSRFVILGLVPRIHTPGFRYVPTLREHRAYGSLPQGRG